MIEIYFDKESEFQWLKAVLKAGTINLSKTEKDTLRQLGIELTQEVTYKSPNYENDIEDKIEEYNKRLDEDN